MIVKRLAAVSAFIVLWLVGSTAAAEFHRPDSVAIIDQPAVVPIASKAAAQRQPAVQGATVYVTKTGAKYHNDGCRHLSRSRIPMALADAAAQYGPCSVCKPPTASATTAAAPRAIARPATSSQCQATTKRGSQCSRKAQAGRSYCWQH
jgi:hypothetical protein